MYVLSFLYHKIHSVKGVYFLKEIVWALAHVCDHSAKQKLLIVETCHSYHAKKGRRAIKLELSELLSAEQIRF